MDALVHTFSSLTIPPIIALLPHAFFPLHPYFKAFQFSSMLLASAIRRTDSIDRVQFIVLLAFEMLPLTNTAQEAQGKDGR